MTSNLYNSSGIRQMQILTIFVVYAMLRVVLWSTSSFVSAAWYNSRQRHWWRWWWRWHTDRSIEFSALQNLINECIVASVRCGCRWWYVCWWWWCCGDVSGPRSSSYVWRCGGCLSCCWLSWFADIIQLRWANQFLLLCCCWLTSDGWSILWPYLY